MSKSYLVVTNCTARKRAGIPLARFDLPLSPCSLAGAVASWRKVLAAQHAVISARTLYVGRSIKEAIVVSEALGAELHIVSAGLGLVAARSIVPGYDLSVAGNASSLPGVLGRIGASVTDWWRELSGGQGLRSLLSGAPTSVVLLALPAEYLRMLLSELESLSLEEMSRLRVFTSIAGARLLEELPAMPVLPYDERLESISGYAGTRSDFPQRALRHFVCHLGAHKLPPDAARREVESSMSSYSARPVIRRRRLTDAELCDLIRKGWDACGGNSARLLRFLRDEERVACEQGRFAELRRRVSPEFVSQHPIAQERADVS